MKQCPGNGGNDKLRDSVPGVNPKRFLSQVYQNDLDLSPVIAIDGARSIQDGYAEPVCKTRPRPYLRFKANRQRNPNSGWNSYPLPRRYVEWFAQMRPEVGSGGSVGCIDRFTPVCSLTRNPHGFRRGNHRR